MCDMAKLIVNETNNIHTFNNSNQLALRNLASSCVHVARKKSDKKTFDYVTRPTKGMLLDGNHY